LEINLNIRTLSLGYSLVLKLAYALESHEAKDVIQTSKLN